MPVFTLDFTLDVYDYTSSKSSGANSQEGEVVENPIRQELQNSVINESAYLL